MNLKLQEIVSVYYELNGLAKQGQESEVLLQGLLQQKMSLKTKIYLQRLNKVVNEELKLYEGARQELFKKYGDEKDGMIEISKKNLDKFNVEHQELLNAQKEINVAELWGDDLKFEHLETIETTEFYPVLFKIIDLK